MEAISPRLAACTNGVSPDPSCAFTSFRTWDGSASTSALIRACTTSKCPASNAKVNGVPPCASLTFRSAPAWARLEQSQCNRAKPPKTELSCRYYSSHLHRLRRESAQARNRYRFVQPHSPTVSCRARLWHSRLLVSGPPEPRSLSGENRPHSKQPT